MAKLLLLMTAFVFFAPRAAHAVPEIKFNQAYPTQVFPFFEKKAKAGIFAGKEGMGIHYQYFANPAARGVVVVVNGFTENMTEYAEFTYDLYQLGYSVFLYDHRGQGASDRILADPHLAYIDQFQFFVDDLKTYVDTIVKPKAGHLPLFLFAHSMGGAIGARYVEQFPNDFRAAVLSAPMFGIRLGTWDPRVARLVLQALHFMGQGASVALGRHESDPRQAPFLKNVLCQSEVRFQAMEAAMAINTKGVLEAPTNDWVMKALDAAKLALAEAKQARLPLLVLQAGEDSIVQAPAEADFCANAPACELFSLSASHHDIMIEADPIRAPAFERMIKFFEAHR